MANVGLLLGARLWYGVCLGHGPLDICTLLVSLGLTLLLHEIL